MSYRRKIRDVIDHIAHRCGLLQSYERRMRRAPTVLMYHRILPAADCANYPFPSLVIAAEMFAEQVRWLAEHTELMTLEDALAAGASERPRGSRPIVAITFDDGYWDNLAIAQPILAEHRVPATFFVTTSFVAGDSLMWYDRAAIALPRTCDAELATQSQRLGVTAPTATTIAEDRVGAWVEAMKASSPATRAEFLNAMEPDVTDGAQRDFYRAMTPADVKTLCEQGHQIGAHSVHHEILPLCDDEALRRELVDSREVVAQWTGSKVDGFCYPNGSIDERVLTATRAAGYTHACTTAPPSRGEAPDPLQIPRIDVTPSRITRANGTFDLVAFRAEISQLHGLLR